MRRCSRVPRGRYDRSAVICRSGRNGATGSSLSRASIFSFFIGFRIVGYERSLRPSAISWLQVNLRWTNRVRQRPPDVSEPNADLSLCARKF